MQSDLDLERILDRVQEWTRFADQKAEAVTAVKAVATGFLFSEINAWLASPYTSPCMKVLLLASSGVLVFGLSYPLRALFPRITSTAPRSVTFFGTIAGWNVDEYRAKLDSMDADAWRADHVSQIHVCSQIATLKFDLLKHGMYWFVGGLAAIAVCYFLELAGF